MEKILSYCWQLFEQAVLQYAAESRKSLRSERIAFLNTLTLVTSFLRYQQMITVGDEISSLSFNSKVERHD